MIDYLRKEGVEENWLSIIDDWLFLEAAGMDGSDVAYQSEISDGYRQRE